MVNRIMQRFNSPIGILILLAILLIPTYWRMIPMGIYSMHDFHVFRLYEFHKCIVDHQIPCRWAPDSTYEYGQPMFNFYGQLPYLLGEPFVLMGFGILTSSKISFVLTLLLSAWSMYFLSKKIWGSALAGFVSALVYTYAPYRAVDVYVRGALPEAAAFIWFPIITYFFNSFIEERRKKDLVLFSFTFACLLITHNLSALMYAIFLLFWGSFLIIKNKAWNLIHWFILGGILIIGLSAFYLLPVLFESKYISLSTTTQGYYRFSDHYTTINQLLFSNKWGYGGSVWGENDGMSFSIGYFQWIFPLIIGLVLLMTKKSINKIHFFILLTIGWFLAFLTHNKSTAIWNTITPMSFIQFPWRFLSLITFTFSLSVGAVMSLAFDQKTKKTILVIILLVLVVINFEFFKEDRWFSLSDKQFFSGENYKIQTSSALTDYWPQFGKAVPQDLAARIVTFNQGLGEGTVLQRKSNYMKAEVKVDSDKADLSLPIVYFPGWNIQIDKKLVSSYPNGNYGLLSSTISSGSHVVEAYFTNTWVRTVGNIISISALFLVILFLRRKSVSQS